MWQKKKWTEMQSSLSLVVHTTFLYKLLKQNYRCRTQSLPPQYLTTNFTLFFWTSSANLDSPSSRFSTNLFDISSETFSLTKRAKSWTNGSRFIVPRTNIKRPTSLPTRTDRGRCVENLINIDSVKIPAKKINDLSRTFYSNTKICLSNARPFRNKASQIKDYIVDSALDMMALTETWITNVEVTLN